MASRVQTNQRIAAVVVGCAMKAPRQEPSTHFDDVVQTGAGIYRDGIERNAPFLALDQALQFEGHVQEDRCLRPVAQGKTERRPRRGWGHRQGSLARQHNGYRLDQAFNTETSLCQ